MKQRDSNTKFFHRFAYGRRTRNYIYFLDFKGRLSDDRAVKNEIIHFYRSFYLKVKTREATFLLWQGNPSQQERISWLKRPFPLEEIEEAVF